MEKTIKWKLAQKLELKWWQRYLAKKPKADYLNWKRSYWTGLLDKCETKLPLHTQANALDIGCGPAGVFLILDQCNVVAVDPLLKKYESELEHFAAKDYPWVDFRNQPFEDFESRGQFELVFAMNAINHFSDLELSAQKLVDLVCPSGYLILTIDAHNFALAKHALRLLPLDALHPHQYDAREYIKMFGQRGCKLVEQIRYQEALLFDHHLFIFKKPQK